MADLARVAQLLQELGILPPEQPAPPPPAYMSVAEFAERLECTPATVHRMIGDGMPALRPRPRLIRIPVIEADEWIRQRTKRPASGRTCAQRGAMQ